VAGESAIETVLGRDRMSGDANRSKVTLRPNVPTPSHQRTFINTLVRRICAPLQGMWADERFVGVDRVVRPDSYPRYEFLGRYLPLPNMSTLVLLELAEQGAGNQPV
jgi:hypothetical protein